MAAFINTNIVSINAQRNLATSQMGLEKAMNRLSSGLRINNAKDDAAGLGISDRFTSQIRGLNQAVRNANDGISLTQTAEGALNTVVDNLQRMRELAVQSANGSNQDVDRKAMQAEVSQLLSEIDRVSDTTEFNGVKLLGGGFSAQQFQVGANAKQTISVSMGSVKTQDLGGGSQAALSGTGRSSSLDEGDLILNGVVVGGTAATSDTFSTVNSSASSIAKAAAINAKSAQTGVKAVANVNEAAGVDQSAAATSSSFTVTINGKTTATLTLSTAGTTAANSTNRATMITAINALSGQTGVVAVDTGDENTGIKLVAADGRNITVSSTATSGQSAAAGFLLGTANTTTYGAITLQSDKDISITTTVSGNLENVGLVAGTYKAQTSYISSNDGLATTDTVVGTSATTDLLSGDVKINGVLIGAANSLSDTYSTSRASQSSIAKAAAINASSKDTGVTAVVNSTTRLGSAMTLVSTDAVSSLTLTINGVTTNAFAVNSTSSVTQRTNVVNAINEKTGQTGVTAVDTGNDTEGIRLVAADGRNIAVGFGSALASSGVVGSLGIGGLVSTSTGSTVTTGSYTLKSSGAIAVEMGTTGNGTAGLGIDVSSYGVGKSGGPLDQLDVSTADGATKALEAIDNALKTVNDQRSNLGALQNRFQTTITNLTTTSENLTSSRSRILDADFASETANLTRGQILQQAGTSMLAQANQLPQGVLSLLR